MAKHTPTVLAEASLNLHKAHFEQGQSRAAFDRAEEPARAELLAEGKPLTVRNVITRQFEIVKRA